MKYNFQRVEKKWQAHWLDEKTYEPDLASAKKPFYNLMMFPYPSAEGLHIGGVRTFTGVDIYGRFKRMQGCDVFEPIGLDGFGINSENYAIKIGEHPAKLSKKTEKNFYRQLEEIGNSFAWEEKLETYDPEYYRWTQWIFIQMFKKGLAYRKKASVNWCPNCLTVLADEQVISGSCERCSTTVIKKDLEQWFFKITDYAERLLNGLDLIDWSENIKSAQRNWIGKSEGARIRFLLVDVLGQEDGKHFVDIFTTRPDTLFGATFIAISPELAKFWIDVGWQASEEVREYIQNSLAKRNEESKEKTGIFSGISAINSSNNERIPLWISDYVLSGYGTGAIMAVPAHDERDFEFAKKFNLPIKKVIEGEGDVYIGAGPLINSGKFVGMASHEAKEKIVAHVGGEQKVQYRLRDWLISRQRYWGPPIPMIWCDVCNKWIPEREENLPIQLPLVKDFRPTGTDKSPLANFPEFYKTKCPECGGEARRETDVSDTFLDSAWYYLRYLDPKNKKELISQELANKWLPVNMYIGGAEHAVLHLLYVRFVSMALHDMNVLSFAKDRGGEPIMCFRSHGLITKDGAKMSKSKGNVVSPDEYIKVYGADAVRMYLAFLAPLEDGGDFNDTGIRGITRFLARVWKYFEDEKNKNAGNIETENHAQNTIKKVTEDIEYLAYNTAISALMVLLTQLEKVPSTEVANAFLKMLAPFAPHLTEEIWREKLKNHDTIHKTLWPTAKTIAEAITFKLIIQINGKVRDSVETAINITEKEALELALSREKIKVFITDGASKKVIFVPRRLINIVV
ncbi:MAG: leucine--tRNA ligase [Patescibacteria group bacterium]